MSREVIVAVVDPASVRGYYRTADGAMSQVAQFAAASDVDPSEVAAIVADLGDRFGWAQAVAPPPTARPTKALPKAPAKGRRDFVSRSDAARIIADYVAGHPGCTRRDLCGVLFPDENYSNPPTAQRVVTRVAYAIAQGVVRNVSSTGADPDRLYPVVVEAPA